MFRAIGLVLSWLPTIVAVVTSIEQIVGDGSGAEKKAVALQAIYRVLGKAGVELSSPVKTILSAVIDALVAVLNLLGVAGFRDTEEQETVELLSASYAREAEEFDEKIHTTHVPEDVVESVAKAVPDTDVFPNDERMNELEDILTQRE